VSSKVAVTVDQLVRTHGLIVIPESISRGLYIHDRSQIATRRCHARHCLRYDRRLCRYPSRIDSSRYPNPSRIDSSHYPSRIDSSHYPSRIDSSHYRYHQGTGDRNGA
jgi:hypothetical protein